MKNTVVQIACEGWCMSRVQKHVLSILPAYYEHVDKEKENKLGTNWTPHGVNFVQVGNEHQA